MSSAGLLNSWVNSYATGGATGIPSVSFITQQVQSGGIPITENAKVPYVITTLNDAFGNVKYAGGDATAGFVNVSGTIRFQDGDEPVGIFQVVVVSSLNGGDVLFNVDLSTIANFTNDDYRFKNTIPFAKLATENLVVSVEWKSANNLGTFRIDSVVVSPINTLNYKGEIPSPS